MATQTTPTTPMATILLPSFRRIERILLCQAFALREIYHIQRLSQSEQWQSRVVDSVLKAGAAQVEHKDVPTKVREPGEAQRHVHDESKGFAMHELLTMLVRLEQHVARLAI